MMGMKIKELRKENGWNRTELAQKIGVGRTTITEYEAGRILPPLDKIQAMAKLFGVPMSYLTGEDVTETPKCDISKQIEKMIVDLKNVDHIITVDGIEMNIEQKSVAASQLESALNFIKYLNKMNKDEQ